MREKRNEEALIVGQQESPAHGLVRVNCACDRWDSLGYVKGVVDTQTDAFDAKLSLELLIDFVGDEANADVNFDAVFGEIWFSHDVFANGGLLELWMSPKPNEKWGKDEILF